MKNQKGITLTSLIIYIVLIIVCTFIVAILGINVSIIAIGSERIIGNEEAKTKNVDCILVLGASVYSNNTCVILAE